MQVSFHLFWADTGMMQYMKCLPFNNNNKITCQTSVHMIV